MFYVCMIFFLLPAVQKLLKIEHVFRSHDHRCTVAFFTGHSVYQVFVTWCLMWIQRQVSCTAVAMTAETYYQLDDDMFGVDGRAMALNSTVYNYTLADDDDAAAAANDSVGPSAYETHRSVCSL